MKINLLKYSVLISSVFFTVSSQALLQVSGGLTLNYFNYSELVDAPAKSNEVGTNFLLSYEVRLGTYSYFDFNGDFSFSSNTKYDGTTFKTNEPITATDENIFHRHEADYYYSITPNFMIYAGVGYRYWQRKLTYGTGYGEVYTWFYTPVGVYVTSEHPLAVKGFVYGVDFSIRPMMNGAMNVVFSETVTGGEDSIMNLGNRTGIKIKGPMSFPFNENIRISVTPWYEYSQIGESNYVTNNTPVSGGGTLGNIHEPDSTTHQYGIDGFVTVTF